MLIRLLSISKSQLLASEKQTAEILAESLKHAEEFKHASIRVKERERPPEGTLPFRRFKYDIIIIGSRIPQSAIESLKKCTAFTHFKADGRMYQTTFYSQFINSLSYK